MACPGGEYQAVPVRPRPAVCSSATITTPSLAPLWASSLQISWVEATQSNRLKSIFTFYFLLCTLHFQLKPAPPLLETQCSNSASPALLDGEQNIAPETKR